MTEDQKQIVTLLCGRTARDKRGVLHTTYPNHGSGEEKAARRALVRLLRSTSKPLDLAVRHLIADLIDPDRDVSRQIRFEYRGKGRPPDAAAEKEVAEFIWTQRRTGAKMMKSVVPAAMEKFGLKGKRILRIWKIWRPILQRLKRVDLDGNPVKPFAAVQHNRD